MNTFPRLAAVFSVFAIIFAAGCGGGGGGANNPPPPPPSGGITRTGVAFAVGPITGFGSVIVNGATYATDGNTTFTKDGQPATQDDFSVGEFVVITGSIDDDNSNAAAASVESNDIVEGPASSHDTTTNQLVVLGQTVQISMTTTSVDDSCPADLTTADAVEVYGSVDTNGVIGATRIECRDATWDGIMEINGLATNVMPTTFQINGLTVNYSAASVDDFPTAGVINEDDPVEAKGDSLDGTTLEADRVEYKGNRFDVNEGDHIEIDGFITRFASVTDFDVSGIPVTTLGDDTTYEGGAAADLGLNLKVEVEGEFDANDVLNATKVEIKTSTAIRVTGMLDSRTGDTLVVLGITVNTSVAKTRFEDKSDADVDRMNVGHLNELVDYVEIRGQEQPPGQITAMIVEREDPDTRTELRGFVEDEGKTEPNLKVLDVTIVTNPATQYRDSRGESESPMEAVDFWLAVQEGSLIDARGTETGAKTLTATEVELKM